MQSSSKSVSTYGEYTGDSPLTAAGVAGAAGADVKVAATPKNKLAANAAVPADNGTVDTTDVTTIASADDDDGRGGAVEKRDSPGEVQKAPSNLSRTSSLSNSPSDDHHHDDALRRSSTGNDAVDVAVRENHEYEHPPPEPYPRAGGMMQHPNHPPPPHLQHRHSPYHPSHYGVLPSHPPPHLHPSHLGVFSVAHHPQASGSGGIGGGGDTAAEGEGEDENSPSASTISTKASLAVTKTHMDRGAREHGVSTPPRDRFFKNYPPTPNCGDGRKGGSYSPSPHRVMYAHHLLSLSSDNINEQQQQSLPTQIPRHPVYEKKSREGAFGRNNNRNNDDDEVDGDSEAKRRRLSNLSFGDNDISSDSHPPPFAGVSSPIPTRKERSPTLALDGCVMAGPLAADGRIMVESPAAASAGAGSSHHSQPSLELGAMPSWDTLGKPLAEWSVCSGNTFNGMEESVKDGVFGSAFSFSESSGVKDNGHRETIITRKEEEDDPSPKSIMSKSGEKRKIAPGTHVQFSRDHDYGGLNIVTSSAGGEGTESRKRSRGMVVVRTSSSAMPPSHPPPPPHHLHDDYYCEDNSPRCAIYPYDQYHTAAGGGRPPPPPYPSHPHDHGRYIEEGPYYDQYYGSSPPPPPPYGYPPHPRQYPSRHPYHRPEYSPPPPHHHSVPPQRPPSSGGGRGRNIYTVHTPPTIMSHGVGPPTSSIHHHPPIKSQFSQIRSAPTAARVGSRDPSFGSWSMEDDDALMDIMRKVKSPKSWVPIAMKFDRGKTAWEIHDRWTRYLKPGSRKGQWTDEEDAVVVETVQNSFEDPFTRWSDLAQRLPGRVGKQVRDRWVNHLNPAINHLPFSREDVSIFFLICLPSSDVSSPHSFFMIIGDAKGSPAMGWAQENRQTMGRNQLHFFQFHSVRKPYKEQSEFYLLLTFVLI